MNAEETQTRRAADKIVSSVIVRTTKQASRSFWSWFRRNNVDSLAVIIVTLTLTVRVVEFALELPYELETKLTGTDKALIIGAVLGPWGAMQIFMFNIYVRLTGKNGNTPPT